MQKFLKNVVTWVKRQFDGSCLIREVSCEEMPRLNMKRKGVKILWQIGVLCCLALIVLAFWCIDRFYCGCVKEEPFFEVAIGASFLLVLVDLLTFSAWRLKSLFPRVPLLFSQSVLQVFFVGCLYLLLSGFNSEDYVCVAILTSVLLFGFLLFVPFRKIVRLLKNANASSTPNAPYLLPTVDFYPVGGVSYLVQMSLFLLGLFLPDDWGVVPFCLFCPYIIVLICRRLTTLLPSVFSGLGVLIFCALVCLILFPSLQAPDPCRCCCELAPYHAQQAFHIKWSIILLLLSGVIPAPKRNAFKGGVRKISR